jgi:DNA-binding CsgD family transcriptional regulator
MTAADETPALSPAAAELYHRALANRGILAPGPADADPDSEARHELVSIGLLGLNPGWEWGLYTAVDPRQAVARWRAVLQEEAVRYAQAADHLGVVFDALAEAYEAAARPGQVSGTSYETLVGGASINQRVGQLVAASLSEVFTLHPVDRNPELLHRGMTRDLEIVGRTGMDYRMLYTTSMRTKPGVLSYVRTLVDAGARFRTLGRLPPRMFLFDARVALIAAAASGGEPVACCLDDLATVAYLRAVYLMLWTTAEPLGGPTPVPGPIELDDTQQKIVLLLREGLGQTQICRRLEMNERTLSTHIATLKALFGVRTLYQLGAAVARRSA